MLRFILIVLVLANLPIFRIPVRRPFHRPFMGFPFRGGWGHRRPPMGHRPAMGPWGMGGRHHGWF